MASPLPVNNHPVEAERKCSFTKCAFHQWHNLGWANRVPALGTSLVGVPESSLASVESSPCPSRRSSLMALILQQQPRQRDHTASPASDCFWVRTHSYGGTTIACPPHHPCYSMGFAQAANPTHYTSVFHVRVANFTYMWFSCCHSAASECIMIAHQSPVLAPLFGSSAARKLAKCSRDT